MLQLVRYTWIDDDGRERVGFLWSLAGKKAAQVSLDDGEALIASRIVREVARAPGGTVIRYEIEQGTEAESTPTGQLARKM